MDYEEITPEDSVGPVYLMPQSKTEIAELAKLNEEVVAAEKARDAARKSALKKLAKLGLTEEEITAITS